METVIDFTIFLFIDLVCARFTIVCFCYNEVNYCRNTWFSNNFRTTLYIFHIDALNSAIFRIKYTGWFNKLIPTEL